jgi:dipeptidyl aminopeptidase/acylaminoacyl peptidase
MSSKTLYNSLFSGTALLCLLNSPVFAGQTIQVSAPSNILPNTTFHSPKMSADGRYVAFSTGVGVTGISITPTGTTHLIAKDSIFIYDQLTYKTEKIGSYSTGDQGQLLSMSADGRYVFFSEDGSGGIGFVPQPSTNISVYDRLKHKTSFLIDIMKEDIIVNVNIKISNNGHYITYQNGLGIAIYDHLTGKTKQINLNKNSPYPVRNLDLSADGRYILFSSAGDNLVKGDTNKKMDLFVYDQKTSKIEQVNVGVNNQQDNGDNSFFDNSSISADGHYVGFVSAGSNLVSGDTNKIADHFVRNRLTHKTERINMSADGKQANGPDVDDSLPIKFSTDGRYVAFESGASNLVAGDTNNATDIFVHDRLSHKMERITVTVEEYSSANFNFSADGRYIAFESPAYNLVSDDADNDSDIFLHDRLLDNHHEADLKIIATTTPTTLKLNSKGNYLYTITNNGKDTVPDVSLIHLVSGGSAVSFKPSQGKCTASTVETVCHLGKLAAGQKLTLQATVKAQSKSVNQQITVSGAPVDNAPNNNHISVTTPIR